jgi:hypothetical protein
MTNFVIQMNDEIGNQVGMSKDVSLFLLKSIALGTDSSNCRITSDRSIYSAIHRTTNSSAVVTYAYNETGLITFQVALLQSGGLSMQIFDGPLFHDLPVVTGTSVPVYSAIDTNFGGGRIDIDFATFYRTSTNSLLWKGFLVPLFTESYTFQLSSNGCTHVSVSGKVLYTCSNIVTNTVTLRANELHVVEISYLHSNGEPSLALFWQSVSQQRELVPSSRWLVSLHRNVCFCLRFLLNLKQVFRFLPSIINVQCKCASRSCLRFSFSTYRNWYDIFV